MIVPGLLLAAMLLGAFLGWKNVRFVRIGPTTAEQRKKAFGVTDGRKRWEEIA